MTRHIEIEYELKVEDDDDIQEYKRPWVGLTQEEIEDSYNADYKVQTKAIERLLKEKNA